MYEVVIRSSRGGGEGMIYCICLFKVAIKNVQCFISSGATGDILVDGFSVEEGEAWLKTPPLYFALKLTDILSL